MNGVLLLSRFAEAATSPLALAAFAIAVAAWLTAAYLRTRLETKGKEILSQFSTDKARLEALRTVFRDPKLGELTDPRDVLEFLRMRDKQQTHKRVLVSRIFMVLTLVTILAMVISRSNREAVPHARENTASATDRPVNDTRSKEEAVQRGSTTVTGAAATPPAATAHRPRTTNAKQPRHKLLAEYAATERDIRVLLRPAAPHPDANYIQKLHDLIRRNREISTEVGEQSSWRDTATLVEKRLPGTLEKLGYPTPEE